MAGPLRICTGCGLKTVDGALTVNLCEACEGARAGLVCTPDGCIDYVVPLIIRRIRSELVYTVVPGISYTAQVPMADYVTEYNSGPDVFTVLPSGAVQVECGGIYEVNVSCGPIRDNDTGRHIGLRARVFKNGTTFGSDGPIIYAPNTIDMTSDNRLDGPETSCSAIIPASAGDQFTYQALAFSSGAGTNFRFPRSVNVVTMARIGSV